MKTKRQQLADLYADYASDDTAYFEWYYTNEWMRSTNTPSIASDLDKWRVTTPYRKEVEEAYKNGARIESRAKDLDTWSKTVNPGWFWNSTDYRIKEVKPFSIYAVITKANLLDKNFYNKYNCESYAIRKGYRCIELIEKVYE